MIESGYQDTDGDGVIDSFIDDNRDGVSDQIVLPEAKDVDSDGDGAADRIEHGDSASIQSGPEIPSELFDTDADGISDHIEGKEDFDNDGLSNLHDLDSDNDGILDAHEAGFTLLTAKDSDADGHPDFLDSDSDNDGLSDVAEVLGISNDQDVDGFIDNFVDKNQNGVDDSVDFVPFYPDDLDNDGVADHLDLDSDGDGIADLVEVNGQDLDGNGLVDGLLDSDGDMIPDSVDVDQTRGDDADGDGIDDIGDADFTEKKLDQDNDGIADEFDIDMNGNGMARSGTADGAPGVNWPDLDRDGVPDVKQLGLSSVTDSAPSSGAALNDQGIIHTGTDGEGFGCSVIANGRNRFDPFMLLLVLCATLSLYRRRSQGYKPKQN